MRSDYPVLPVYISNEKDTSCGKKAASNFIRGPVISNLDGCHMTDDPLREAALSHLVSVLLDFRGLKIRDYCQSKLDSGIDPFAIFGELQLGLEEIGKGYEDPGFRRYFNSDLIVSGRNMKRAIDLLKRKGAGSYWYCGR
jgi:methanogenic corrinoid protein MtbC1